jgi:hypothetical protein
MLRRVCSMRLVSLSALPYLALEAAAIATAWGASGPGAAVTRALCIAGAVVLAVAGGWWLWSPRPPGTRADRRRLVQALARIADGRAWVARGQVLRCQASRPGSWELLVADRDQDDPADQDGPGDLDSLDELEALYALEVPDDLEGLYDQEAPGAGIPVTFTAFSVSRRAVSRRTGAWLMEPGPDGALTPPPEPRRSRRERVAAAVRVLRLSRTGLLDADAAEIAGLTALATAAVRYSPD